MSYERFGRCVKNGGKGQNGGMGRVRDWEEMGEFNLNE